MPICTVWLPVKVVHLNPGHDNEPLLYSLIFRFWLEHLWRWFTEADDWFSFTFPEFYPVLFPLQSLILPSTWLVQEGGCLLSSQPTFLTSSYIMLPCPGQDLGKNKNMDHLSTGLKALEQVYTTFYNSLHWTILILFFVLFVQWSIFPSVHLIKSVFVDLVCKEELNLMLKVSDF